jgi:hypothetical protein
MIMSYLCEFSIIKHNLTLDSDIFTCRLEEPKRREDHVLLFFCYNKISLGSKGIIQS